MTGTSLASFSPALSFWAECIVKFFVCFKQEPVADDLEDSGHTFVFSTSFEVRVMSLDLLTE